MSTTHRTIVLKGNGFYEELFAAAGLTPGHLIELTAAGKVQKHSTEAGFAERLFAKQSELSGKTIDTAYTTNDLVFCYVGQPGDVVNAYIKAGSNVGIGEQLISAGDGTLIPINEVSTSTVSLRQVIAVATEALDLTATAAVNTRLAVRLL